MTVDVSACYQCGKCTAGCPVAARMDVMPNQLIRLVQLEQPGRAMQSGAIWQCLGCQTCSTRCPKAVDCAGVMDWLQEQAARAAVAAPAHRRTLLFQQAFLRNIRRNGRLAELELVAAFKTSGFLDGLNLPFLFKDALLGPRMAARGKLKLKPGTVRDRGVVERIFERCDS